MCGVIRSGETVGMTTQASAAVLVKPPSLPTMPKTAAPTLSRELEGAHQVHRDVLLAVAAADREDEQRVARAEARDLEPLGEARVPALVVHARGQLGDVVGRRVGLEAADLAEVVDRVAGVAGRAADAEDEEAPARVAHAPEADRPAPRSPAASISRTACSVSCEEQVDEAAASRRSQLEPRRLRRRVKNICTVSRLKSARSLPTSSSFLSRSGVTVMMSQPISAAWMMLSSSRGLAQSSSIACRRRGRSTAPPS